MVRLVLHSIAYEAKTLNLTKAGFTAYYVDVTDGQDTHDGGSWAQAFKTIQHAIDESESWAKIFVKAGTYNENVVINNKQGIHIVGEDRETTILNGGASYVLSGNTSSSTFEGLSLKTTSLSFLVALTGKNVTFRNCVVDTTGLGLIINTDYNIIEDIRVDAVASTYPAISVGGKYSQVSHCLIDCSNDFGISLLANCQYAKVFENTIKGVSASNYAIRTDTTADNNTIFHNNLISNANQIRDDGTGNEWVENYYDNHTTDTNNDGLTDTAYTEAGATDYQPVSRRNGWKQESLGVSASGAGDATAAKQDIIIANQAGEETLSSYNLPNDTAENTAIEVTNTKRLKLDSVWLDFVNLVQDATIKVYHKIDGSTYRQYDEFSWATTEEDGILLRDVTINGDWKLTVTSTVAQGAIKAIPYNVIKTTMEA